MGGYMMSAIYSIVFVGVSWVVVDMLGLTGTAAYVARSVLIAIAVSIFALRYYFSRRKQKRRAKATEEVRKDSDEEIDYLIKEAQSRLVKSRLGREAKLGSLPIVFLVGESGSAKTSNFIQSGVEPELLSGQVRQDATIVATRPANFWYGKSAVFVEAGGTLLDDQDRWKRLMKKLGASKLRSLFGRRLRAPRGVVVCVDCESLARPGADEPLKVTARKLHQRLGEMAQILGVHLPVYVLFARTDRIAYFSEFVANLTDREIGQVFGSTVELRVGTRDGVYAEEETRRLTDAFNQLFYALCDKRPPYLAREHQDERSAAIYEFPREFRKLRTNAVQFLVDLCRPSQLRAGPLLRGFYFSGVRPIVVEEKAAARVSRERTSEEDNDATGIFDVRDQVNTEEMVTRPARRKRRVPQWVFLSSLFSQVILKDREAQGAGGGGVRAQNLRRWLLGSAIALFGVWLIGMTVSYFENDALEAEVLVAARGISIAEGGGARETLPSQDALERLDTLRVSVGKLSEYEREGAPWSLAWGLYIGSDLYPPLRRLYFNRFHQLLFGATQGALLDWLQNLPRGPGPDDEYKPSYDTLKAYLITTSYHDKSTREFLSPFLLTRWRGGREVDPERLALAQRQFDFYAEELLLANPFSDENDEDAIFGARRYLAQFNAVERMYQALISQASEKNPSINFNKQIEGSAGYVVNNRDVLGAFSLEGWAFMDEAISNSGEFFGGERWVLGDEAFANLDTEELEPALRARYHADFIGNWRQYLQNSAIVRYRSVPDAARKLNQLSGNQSYLLALFCLASENTNVDNEDVKAAFQPLHYLTPPGCTERYVSDNNASYMSGLVNLQASMERVGRAGTSVSEDLLSATLGDASAALRVARQVAQRFRIDREGGVNRMTQKLMEDPVRYAEAILGRLGPAQINSAGKRLCTEFFRLTGKYPFKSDAPVDATIEELNGIFRPGDGRLWSLYEGSLRSYLEVRNGRYERKAGAKVRITDKFLGFFNRATRFSAALYPRGANEPRLAYTMQALRAEGIRSLTLSLDGQTLKADRQGGGPKEFFWPGGGARSARLAGSLGGPEFGFIAYDGLWATFRFFADADRFEASGSRYTLEWVPRQGQSGQPMTLGNGKALTLPFLLDLKGAPPIFRKGYLSGFGCVAQVAR